ncbi:ABC transporter substrate-binding protein [Actinoplanes couchii]|uniref:Thiamine pyrimidine synthase n=1 Tax=Actinoplanes couchii TaxID=403638 RepID=A0ABQ3WZP3_9ACTN|nr:ABC transporter substrate-binding protein [Actinoplanes couchii]MDR6316121.1 NitT/TauT family transport system substrate-binding protein [Actinoplanes couchii]GID51736.1 nitrate ABC transporter substrate-binding protein [Actinoplanes couchii]
MKYRFVSAAVAVLTLAACNTAPEEPKAQSAPAISDERCAQNKAAGKITYLSGYQWQSSASILEYVAADDLGYFEALCLDVAMQPGTGDTSQNTKLLASGQVTFSPVSQQDVLSANANGIKVQGVSTYSRVGLEILMTMPEITDLKQLNGTTLGQKGAMPVGVQAMLAKAGADYDSIKQVVVGYDPSILPRGQVKSLTGFISNEPNQLAAAKTEVKVWRPYDYDVPGSLGAMAVNPEFAAKHPTAVQDFLRAGLHAFEHCEKNGAQCVAAAADLTGAGYDEKHNLKIWETEVGVIRETLKAGTPLGAIDTGNVQSLVALLNTYGKTSIDPAVGAAEFNTSYIKEIYSGDTLVWPAP